MSSFTFHNPALVRRFGTFMIVGTSVILMLLTLWLTNIAGNNYDTINDRKHAISRATAAVAAQANPQSELTYYAADTPQLAQSDMQSDMQELAGQSNVSLEVIRADQVEQIDGALRLALTLNGVVEEDQLGGFLASLANHEPMIVVDSVSLRRARSTNRGVDERPLAIQLKLSGFAQQ